MTMNAAGRKIARMSWAAVGLMLCALPTFAEDNGSGAASAQQGGHYEAGETRSRRGPRVIRARPGGINVEPNQEVASPGIVDDGVPMGGAGLSQGAADKKIGQGSGSSSGSGGGGGGSSNGPLEKSTGTQTGGGSKSGKDLCSEQGLANAEVIYDYPGGWSRIFMLGPKQCLSMKMVIPVGTPEQTTELSSAYDGVSPADWSFSENKCDFSPSLGTCAGNSKDQRYRIDVAALIATEKPKSGVKSRLCALTPGKTYYVNIKRAGLAAGPGTVWLWVSGFGNCNPNPTNGPVTCPPGVAHKLDLTSLKYTSASLGSSLGRPAPQPTNPVPPRVPLPANPQPLPANPQPPSQQQPSPACGIGTSGSGSWSLSTVPLEVSPPPPPCDACVRAGGHCAPGSSCTVVGGNGHYSCR